MAVRPLLLALALSGGFVAKPQTTTSVQDGDWGDPATWDCNCIPEVVNAVVVHQVRIATNTFLMQRVHVMPVGSLVMDEFFSVAIMDTVINDGLMDLKGDIDVDWALLNNSTIHIEGVIHNDALLVMGGPDALLTTDNIGNYDTIEGEGRICVAGFTENTGTIQGLIDFCDLTPTVSSPPYIDDNTGVVAGSVTFCAAVGCGPSAIDTPNALSGVRIWPVPAQDHLELEVPVESSIELLDASGRIVLARSIQNRGPVTLGIAHLPVGLYAAVIRAGEEHGILRFMIAR
ncbi:MAG: hypothetical protein IPM46_04945 [Flavobacteriales bacterium]|nr:hypothetical protein [Flavobacteriales bacterium]